MELTKKEEELVTLLQGKVKDAIEEQTRGLQQQLDTVVI